MNTEQAGVIRGYDGQREAQRRPNLFIIGAPKSGTTSLYEFLAGHPDVWMSPVKEPAYFSPDAPSPRNRYPYGEGLPAYLALFEGATTEKLRGEASTYYLFSRQAPGLIREFEPAARIVAILRNPVGMMAALHSQRLEHGDERIPEFEKALAADLIEGYGGQERAATVRRAGSYRARARYAEQLAPWLETFGRAQCHVMIFDDFVADTAGELRRLLQFLEVDPDYRPESLAARNKSHRMRGGVIGGAMRSSPARWLRHSLLPAVIGRDRAARLGRRFKQSRVVRSESDRPELTPGLRARLEDELAPDVRRLSEMLGRDLLSEWFGDRATRQQAGDPAAVP